VSERSELIAKYVAEASAELGLQPGAPVSRAQAAAVVAKVLPKLTAEVDAAIGRIEKQRQGSTVEQRRALAEAVAKLSARIEQLEARGGLGGARNGHATSSVLKGIL
jgi:glutathione S-transferase